MPDNKRQHYVPKSTLRRFACDFGVNPKPRQLNIINIEHSKIIYGASLKEQCYRDYFYGSDTFWETELSKIEGVFSKLTSKMIITKSIHQRDGLHLALMVALQKARTLRAEEEFNGIFDRFAKLMMYGRMSEDELRNIKIGMKGTANFNIGQSLALGPIILDLKRFLVYNKTSVPFIVSDNPVISTNWFCRLKYPERSGGIARSGLQIFMPLSPQFALLMHDGNVYKCDNEQDVISIRQKNEVNDLNELQWLNAYKNVYFPPLFDANSIKNLMNVTRESGALFDFNRLDRLSNQNHYVLSEKDEFSPPTEGVKSEIVWIAPKFLPKDVRIRNVRLRDRPIFHDDGSMASPLRDPAWQQIVVDFSALVRKQRGSFADLWGFVERHPRASDIGGWLSRVERRSKRSKH